MMMLRYTLIFTTGFDPLAPVTVPYVKNKLLKIRHLKHTSATLLLLQFNNVDQIGVPYYLLRHNW